MLESIPYIPLVMSIGSLAVTPELPLPPGYSLRLFRPGDEANWAEIAVSAGEFAAPEDALAYFAQHFGPQLGQLPLRCLFLLDGDGRPAGTATGWFMDEDSAVGRLHWVSIAKEHQGRGLCKPMVAAAMRLMRDLGHENAMLTTQPKSWKGIRVYLDLGWRPHDDGTADYKRGWAVVKELTGREELSDF